MRYFPNTNNDVESGSLVTINKKKWIDSIENIVKLIINKMPASSLENCDGGLYVGNAGVAYMLYCLTKSDALGDELKKYCAEQCRVYFDAALNFAESTNDRDPAVSFLLGKAGVYSVGTAISSLNGDQAQVERFINEYISLGELCKPIIIFPYGSDELFVGRAGYLFGSFFINNVLQREAIKHNLSLCQSIIQSGKKYASKHESLSPLMYSYHGTEYLGAAHGLSSILLALLCTDNLFETCPSAETEIKQSIDFLLSIEQPNSNYAPAMDEVNMVQKRPLSEELIHWCHGAPGIIYVFARAYQVWKDEKYLQACIRCGELTWKAGLLKKGPGICHGIAGNGYVFLLLYRLTKDTKYLHRAQCFAEFIFTTEFQNGARTPDAPYSLYEGWAGTVLFLLSLLNPETAEYPFFNVLS
ncbi:3 [Octopus vulgaris]|uniref:3 n=2 Tax=Octopus TaxID=6643 RepID=A0AA36FK25_OCTVU|nr:lanC-like protein 3 [Octopus sinensis]CAI9736988.1 3 [Octopus vulgaris] [Octopus vulgaris]